MKKFVLILSIFILFMSTVHADISGRIDSLMIMAFEQSLVPDGGNALVDTFYGHRVVNRAIQRVCYDFPAIEKMDTIVSVSAQIEYALNSDFLRPKTIFKLTTFQNLKIIYSLTSPPVESWFEVKGGEIGGQPDPNQKAEPRYAFTFNDKVYLYPTPQTADSFVVVYYAIDSQIETSSNSTSVRPEYREMIVIYAASLICFRKGDFVRAREYMNLYNSRLSRPQGSQ